VNSPLEKTGFVTVYYLFLQKIKRFEKDNIPYEKPSKTLKKDCALEKDFCPFLPLFFADILPVIYTIIFKNGFHFFFLFSYLISVLTFSFSVMRNLEKFFPKQKKQI